MKELIGSRLKALRERHNWTQEKFAEMIDVRRSTYISYEKGTGNVDARVLKAVIDVTGCSPYYLLGMQEAERDQDCELMEKLGIDNAAIMGLRNNLDLLDFVNTALSSKLFWNAAMYAKLAVAIAEGKNIENGDTFYHATDEASKNLRNLIDLYLVNHDCVMDYINEVDKQERLARMYVEMVKKFEANDGKVEEVDKPDEKIDTKE